VEDYKEVLDKLDEIEAELADWLNVPLAVASARDGASSLDAGAPGTSLPPLSEGKPVTLTVP